MKVDAPTFFLKEACPQCKQGSSLAFYTCKACTRLVLACLEEGIVFPCPMNLDERTSTSWGPGELQVKCPNCQVESAFRASTGEEIHRLGFSPLDYD